MKKICLIVSALILMLCVTACGPVVIIKEPPAPIPTKAEPPVTAVSYVPPVSEMELPEMEMPKNETPTAPPASKTAAPQSGVSLETMTAAEKREVNLFLSNFSEVSYGIYVTEETANKLHFAFMHNVINNKNFKKYFSNSEYRISADLVDKTLNRFFGHSIERAEPAGSEWRYENGYFYTAAADGESVSYFTVAKSLTDNHNGTYTVQFDVFSAPGPHDPIDSSWYSLSHAQAISRFERVYGGTAVVKPKTHNGSATYEMVDYNAK